MRPGVRQAWLARALAYVGDECQLAPFLGQQGGYVQVTQHGLKVYMHRAACEAEHGPPPTPEHEAAHSCGNRACANRRHVTWKTHADNMADQEADGTVAWGERSGKNTLTASQVQEIRSTPKVRGTGRELATRFGVHPATICLIRSGRNWRRMEPAA